MKASHFFFVALLLLVIGGVAILVDRHTASASVTKILVTDKTTNVSASQLSILQRFVHTHMETSLSFELTGQYNRDLQESEATAAPQASGDVYHQAQAACASIKNAVDQAQCNQQYISAHSQAPTSGAVATPQPASYTYHFVSDSWTPDLAGICLAAGVILAIIGAVILLFPV